MNDDNDELKILLDLFDAEIPTYYDPHSDSLDYCNCNFCNSLSDEYFPSVSPSPTENERVQIEEIRFSDANDNDHDANIQKQTEYYPVKTEQTYEGDGLILASMQSDSSEKHMVCNESSQEVESHTENIIFKDFVIKGLFKLETLVQICQNQNLKFIHSTDYSTQDVKSEEHVVSNGSLKELESHTEKIISKDFIVRGLSNLETLIPISQSKNSKFTHSINTPMSDDNFEKHMVSNESLEETKSRKENIIFKDFEIRALSKLETFVQICQSQNLKFCPFMTSFSRPIYNIDMILGHKVNDGETYYFIKWKKLRSEHCSWEPSSNLQNFIEIQYYHALQSSQTVLDHNLIEYFITELYSQELIDILTITKVLAAAHGKSEKAVKKLGMSAEEMQRKLCATPIKKFIQLKDILKFMKFGYARKWVLINLSEWQDKVNSKIKPYVKFENNVDLETFPNNFEFISDNLNTVINIPEEPIVFCECQNCYTQKNTCCPHHFDACFAYDKYNHLILEPGYTIFECNRKCSCDSNCVNRVVQHGRKIKVCIFKTFNRGWGLKTLETIEKGQFVAEYIGEIITSNAADDRGRVYDYDRQSYLFNLDCEFNNTSSIFTIDASHFGNVSHFINHSCDPNLHVFAVFINQHDPRLPRVAFFAKKKISIGEELTFDYRMDAKKSKIDQKKRIYCKCNSKKCRRYLF